MITTVDGVEKYPGDIVWAIWFTDKYVAKSILAEKHIRGMVFDSEELAKEQCRLLNELP